MSLYVFLHGDESLPYDTNQDPDVRSVVTLTSSLDVKMLTVLVNTISNSQVFLLEKNVSSFCKCKSYSHFFFSKTNSVYAIFNDHICNEQLGPGHFSFF